MAEIFALSAASWVISAVRDHLTALTKDVWEEESNLYEDAFLLPLLGPPPGETTRPEEAINSYLRLLKGIGNVATALGALALLWSTVVHLGGFVTDLRVKDFWFVTVLSFIMACKVVQTINVFRKDMEIYLQEANIIHIIGGKDWNKAAARLQRVAPKVAGLQFTMEKIMLLMVLVPKVILFFTLGLCLVWSPTATLVLSVLRLAIRDYSSDPIVDTAKRARLNAALNIFYSLVVFQSLFTLYYMVIISWLNMTVKQVAFLLPKRKFKYERKVVRMYCSETERMLEKTGEVPDIWNLITYGVGLLESASGDDNLWGARILDQYFDEDISVRQELLSSRLSIQNLICMIGWRGSTADNIEKRERAARIFARVASDLHIAHFSGTLECICSLLDSSCELFTCPLENPPQDHHQDDVRERSFSKRCIRTVSFNPKKRIKDAQHKRNFFGPRYQHAYDSRGAKELICQGMFILERLTQDELNCAEIIKHQLLLSKITAHLRSHHFIRNVQDDTMVEVLSKSLTVVSRLLTSTGDGATLLRQELASNMEAVSNLTGILEADSKGAHRELHEQALEILAELALASFTKPACGESAFMFNKLFENLKIFPEEKDGATIVAGPGTEKAPRVLSVKAKDALDRLLLFESARMVEAAAKISKHDAINLLTKVLDKTSSRNVGSHSQEEADSLQPPTQGSEEKSKEAEAFMQNMLFFAAAMRVVTVTSKQDFTRPSPEDEALAKKLMDILELNKGSSAGFFRTLKLTCHVVIPIVRAFPASCIKYLNERNFKKALIDILETMNGRELPKSLAAHMKEMKDHLVLEAAKPSV